MLPAQITGSLGVFYELGMSDMRVVAVGIPKHRRSLTIVHAS
jgi:hypothetical protein